MTEDPKTDEIAKPEFVSAPWFKNLPYTQKAVAYTAIVSALASPEVQKEMNMGHLDDLTGLPNRRGFLIELEKTLAEHPNPENLALIFMDLDKLKELNDSEGHLRGDEYIKFFGRFLERHFRESDIVSHNVSGRFGGDEFMTLVDLTSRDDSDENFNLGVAASTMLSRLHKQFKQEVEKTEGLKGRGLSFSSGSVFHQRGVPASLWLAEADAGMYAQKRARNEQTRSKLRLEY